MEKMKLNIQLFNGSVAIQTITETTDIYTNQSTFTIPAKMTTTGSTYNNSNAYMTLQWKYASDSSWTSLNKQTFGIGKSSSKTKSWTLTLTHNNDGTLENVQFRVKWYITDSTNGTTGATTYTPTTIPRGSEFDTLNWNRDTQILLNSTISIPAIQHISPAYHKLEARFMINGNEQVVATWTGISITNGYISFSFTTAQLSTIYNLMPSQTTHYIRMYLYTYSDSSYSTLIGEESVIWWTGLIPDNVVPVAHMSYSEGGDTPSSWGVYVKGKSKLNLILTGSGTASSTITSYLISGDGYTYNSNTALTNYLSKSGNITFTGIVTDSRGRQGSWDVTIYALDYYNPSISTAQVQRCDENGNIDRNGEYLYISYGANISSCGNRNKANAHYKVGYRVQDTGSYQYVDLASNVDSYSATGMLYTDGIYAADRGSGTKVQFSTSNTFDIQFYVDDTFNPNGQTNTQQLDTGFDLMNFNPSGKSMAIGKVSEASASEEKLEIGINTEIDGGNLTIKTGNNVYSPIDITGDNPNNESSIIYRNKANGDAYIVGCNTFGQEGWNIGFAGYGNLFRLTKGGDIYTSGVRGNVAKFQTIQDVDLNDIGDNYPSGFYKIYANANDPYNSGGTWYYVYQVHDVDDNQWCYQEVVQWWEPLKKFARRKVSGSWESWHILSHGIYELYNGNSTGDITLSDHAWNYSYIEIFYQGADNYNSVKVPSPHGKRVYLTTGWFSDNINGNFKMANIYINDTTISKVNYTALSYWNGGASASQENGIEIIKVIGYK